MKSISANLCVVIVILNMHCVVISIMNKIILIEKFLLFFVFIVKEVFHNQIFCTCIISM